VTLAAAGSAWITLRLVFEEVVEIRFSEPAEHSLQFSWVGDRTDSVIAFSDCRFRFDYLGLRSEPGRPADVWRDRALTQPCAYVIARRCLWEALPFGYDE
jgi:hypothetical protein